MGYKEVKPVIKKNILFIAYYFPPIASGGTLRSLKFVKYLSRYAWQPHVLTVRNPHHLSYDFDLVKQIPSDIPVQRTFSLLPGRFFRRRLHYDATAGKNDATGRDSVLKTIFLFLKNWFYSLFFIPDEQIGWLPFALFRGWRMIRKNRIRIVLSTSPPNSCHLIAYWLKKITGVLWVADFRDLWDQYRYDYNPFRLRWKVKTNAFLERIVLSACDRIVVISEVMKRQLMEKYPQLPDGKINVIYNGFDPEDFLAEFPEVRTHDQCIILHTGTVSAWRNPTTFLRVFRQLCDENEDFNNQVKIRFQGLVFPEVRREIEKLALQAHVSFLPHQPYAKNIAKLRQADYLLLIVGDLPQAANALAVKLFDYIGAGRPIMALAPAGETERVIRKYRLGLVADPNDAAQIRAMLLSAYKNWQKGTIPGSAKRNAVKKRFDRRRLTGELSAVFDELSGTDLHA